MGIAFSNHTWIEHKFEGVYAFTVGDAVEQVRKAADIQLKGISHCWYIEHDVVEQE